MTNNPTDERLRQWAETHNIDNRCLTDLRCAYEDAASFNPAPQGQAVEAERKLLKIAEFVRRNGWDRAEDVRDQVREILREGHSPDCDFVSDNPEGITKPCNCGHFTPPAAPAGEATDTEILDWLENATKVYHLTICKQPHGQEIHHRTPFRGSVRAAVRAAMRATQQGAGEGKT